MLLGDLLCSEAMKVLEHIMEGSRKQEICFATSSLLTTTTSSFFPTTGAMVVGRGVAHNYRGGGVAHAVIRLGGYDSGGGLGGSDMC